MVQSLTHMIYILQPIGLILIFGLYLDLYYNNLLYIYVMLYVLMITICDNICILSSGLELQQQTCIVLVIALNAYIQPRLWKIWWYLYSVTKNTLPAWKCFRHLDLNKYLFSRHTECLIYKFKYEAIINQLAVQTKLLLWANW